MDELNILSLNVKGLRDGNKRRELFRWMKRYYNADKSFVFLQETHSASMNEKNWIKEWGQEITFSHGKTDARGVCILFPSRNSAFVIEKTWADNDGRIAMVRIKCENESYTLINIYAPTKNHPQSQLDLLAALKHILSENEDSSFIIGGDLNTYLNPILDRDCTKAESLTKYAKEILNIMETNELIDIWRVLNPVTKRYTWQ